MTLSTPAENPKQFSDFYKTAYNPSIVVSPKYRDALAFFQANGIRELLDLGAGVGGFSQLYKQGFPESHPVAVDISSEAVEKAKSNGVDAYCVDIGKQPIPFDNDRFEGIFCGEIIEHVYDTDHFLKEAFRLIKPSTPDHLYPVILTTPNLSSWYNRIFLLFGYQPLFTEVSTENGFGHPFPFWLKAGHIRVFTCRALKEFVTYHGFQIKTVKGYGINTEVGYGARHKGLARLINTLMRPFPSLSSDLMIVIYKKAGPAPRQPSA